MIFDGHSDILTDLTIRYAEGDDNPFKSKHKNDLDVGQVKGGILVLWPEPPNDTRPNERTGELLESLNKETGKGHIKLVRNYQELMLSWEKDEFTAFLGAEGISSVQDNLEYIDYLYEVGLRHCSLTWNESNQFATGVTGDPHRGLSVLGKSVVRKIEDKGILLDLSHLNEKSFWDVAKIANKPLIASHSNLRRLCDHDRNLTDDQVKFIKETGGLIGINSYKGFVSTEPVGQTVDGFVRHAVEASEMIGVDHVALGFDYFGYLEADVIDSFSESSPSVKGLENASKSQSIIMKLRDAGFNKDEIEKLCFKNYFRIIKEVIG